MGTVRSKNFCLVVGQTSRFITGRQHREPVHHISIALAMQSRVSAMNVGYLSIFLNLIYLLLGWPQHISPESIEMRLLLVGDSMST